MSLKLIDSDPQVIYDTFYSDIIWTKEMAMLCQKNNHQILVYHLSIWLVIE